MKADRPFTCIKPLHTYNDTLSSFVIASWGIFVKINLRVTLFYK